MKKYLLWGLVVIVFSMIGGFTTTYFAQKYTMFEKDDDFLDIPIEFKKTYLGPTERRWTKYVDNLLPPIIQQGDTNAPYVALTFDDGPHPESTDTILEILKTFNIKATFFIVGSQAEKYPQLVKKISEAGHEIGNHTYSHSRLTDIPHDEIINELEQTRTIIFNETGTIPILFRPPGGKFNGEVLGIARELNYSTVLWTNNAGDWLKIPAKQLSEKVVQNTSAGSIILMHNSDFSSTVTALPDIIQRVKAAGYEFTTISSLLQRPTALANRNSTAPILTR